MYVFVDLALSEAERLYSSCGCITPKEKCFDTNEISD